MYVYIYIQSQLYNYCILYIRECYVYRGDTGLGCGMSRYDLHIYIYIYTYVYIYKVHSTIIVCCTFESVMCTEGTRVWAVACRDTIGLARSKGSSSQRAAFRA